MPVIKKALDRPIVPLFPENSSCFPSVTLEKVYGLTVNAFFQYLHPVCLSGGAFNALFSGFFMVKTPFGNRKVIQNPSITKQSSINRHKQDKSFCRSAGSIHARTEYGSLCCSFLGAMANFL